MSFLLTIAGHDPVHGAGFTADLATWAAMGLDGASVATALTVQNSSGLTRVEPVAATLVRDALQTVLRDGEPRAVKIGMLGSAAVAREVAEFIAARRCPVVVDPVLAASNGRSAHEGQAAFLPALRALMRHADVITPNLPEALALLGDEPVSLPALRGLCRGAVVLKGGHAEGEHSVDWVADATRTALLSASRLATPAHGTGCVLSAALAGLMAQGWDVFDAATEAKLRVHAGIAQARPRPGRPHTLAAPRLDSAHLPTLQWVSRGAVAAVAELPFAALDEAPGLYPVLPDAEWVERLLAAGVRTVQLRIKAGDKTEADTRAQIERAVLAGRRVPGAQVFINDHWRLALELGAYGVHLGQEDLDTADLARLRQAGLRLGVSSHTPAEMARAHAVQPSYVAIGPVYPTTLKAMRYEAVGLERLRQWTAAYQPRYPVVAIGGISLERVPGVLACGVDGLAVVSAITQADDPDEATRALMHLVRANGVRR